MSCILKVILAVFLLLWYVSTGILSLSLRVELTSALCQKHCTNQEDLIQSNLVSPLSSKHHFIKSSMLIVVAHCGFCWFCVIVASTMNHICSLSSTFFFFSCLLRLFCVFTHVASIYANSLEQKKAFT